MNKCCCSTKSRLIYSCSGAANTGEIADQISRKLAKEGYGNMTCLASVGTHISGFVESAKGADENITIDGCSIACAKKILENIGVTPIKSFTVTEMGIEKGKTLVTEEIINEISNKIKKGISSKAEQENNGKGDKNSGCSCRSH
ncbi:MAG: hypothetical protein Kow00103_14750 [Candidatus Caldatribacteriota bacterium]